MHRIFMVCAVLMVFVSTSYAQEAPSKQLDDKPSIKSYIFQWTGDDGIVHITDELGKVPKKYRSKAVKLEQVHKEGDGQGAAVPQAVPPPDSTDEERVERDKKAEWQYRMQEARRRLADAEQHYRELDNKRTALLATAWTKPLPIAARSEAEKIAEEMKTVQLEIDDARRMIEVVIPEEARKNGVPPGWLRESH